MERIKMLFRISHTSDKIKVSDRQLKVSRGNLLLLPKKTINACEPDNATIETLEKMIENDPMVASMFPRGWEY
jgi:hypothetical protein